LWLLFFGRGRLGYFSNGLPKVEQRLHARRRGSAAREEVGLGPGSRLVIGPRQGIQLLEIVVKIILGWGRKVSHGAHKMVSWFQKLRESQQEIENRNASSTTKLLTRSKMWNTIDSLTARWQAKWRELRKADCRIGALGICFRKSCTVVPRFRNNQTSNLVAGHYIRQPGVYLATV
jgi:hypothetical protein